MTDNSRISTVVTHLPNGKFAPGNPGRPRGSKNRVSNTALQAVKSMSDDAINQLKSKLASGDWQAICFVLERILPRGRVLELDGVTPEEVMAQMIDGEITTVEAKDLAVALKSLTEISEIGEINNRLKLLEAMLTGDVR